MHVRLSFRNCAILLPSLLNPPAQRLTTVEEFPLVCPRSSPTADTLALSVFQSSHVSSFCRASFSSRISSFVKKYAPSSRLLWAPAQRAFSSPHARRHKWRPLNGKWTETAE
ncbi:hypothetical protein TGMAS_358990 [Toxoplasma gondii MAS]|uniref:Uncharacterized protein n=2 Tax=Toxoplasma gondii TaxID=5811 RepID=A0A086Q237_TOXGO|nr:hypothetical protein TGP89_358990 [Toxoplasma gondii p89]KFH06669.1 hypothetical protein TGMAS_358990 [Toxoplasma gondii MAS]